MEDADGPDEGRPRTGLVSIVRALPQPLKTFYVLWLLAVPLAVVLATTSRGFATGLTVGSIAVLTGLTLVTDYRGGARALARTMKTARPLGVDYSRSFFATTAYARLFGAFAVLIGSGFLYAALTSPR